MSTGAANANSRHARAADERPSELTIETDNSPTLLDDLSREVYSVFGMPIDAIEMQEVIARSVRAAALRRPFLISTLNLNFLAQYQLDARFRNAILLSDLCLSDGMPVVWLGRMLGVPITERVAGSDLFDSFKRRRGPGLKVFLFGGGRGVAAAAAKALNNNSTGMKCVGFLFPGFASVDEMSCDDFIDQINESNADFLVVSLGAQKGQAWLERNHDRLRVPVRSHLGATINFEAGKVRRAPAWIWKHGLEWLWRIKEEPYLWKRYVKDGYELVRLLLARGIPLALQRLWLCLICRINRKDLLVKRSQDNDRIILGFSGDATTVHVNKAIVWFRDAMSLKMKIIVDFSGTRVIDARFLGLLLMVRKMI